MIKLTSIDSLTNFQKNAKHFVETLAASKEPLVLTVNGKAKLVIQDAAAYQRLIDQAERSRFAEAIREGLKDIREGITHLAEEVFAELDAEYGI